MKKLIALTAYLKSLNLVAPELIESWVVDAQTPLFFDDNTHGLECSRVPYTARFYLERYTGDAATLMAYIACWLMEHDEGDEHLRTNEELAPPSYNITPLDDNLNVFDIDITIEFVERIYLIEDINGGFEFRGKRWTIGDYDLWLAEQAKVNSNYPPIEGANP